MPKYINNAQNRRLKRVGKGYGKMCKPCEVKENKKKLITNKGRPTKPPPKKEKGYTSEKGTAGQWVKGKFIPVKKKEPLVKRAEIRRIEPLPLSDRKKVIDLRTQKTKKNTDIEKFLKEHEFKTNPQKTKFNQIHDAHKAQKIMNRVDGKSVKYTIQGNKVTLKYGYINIADIHSDPPNFTDTKSVFNLNSKCQ